MSTSESKAAVGPSESQLPISRSVPLQRLQKLMEAAGTEGRLALENASQTGTWSCKIQEHSKSPLCESLHHAPSLLEKQSWQNNNHNY